MRKTLNPKTLFNSRQYGFSQIAISQPGKHIFISGQVAWDENEQAVGVDDLEKQTQKAIDNLNAAIQAAGGSLDHIMRLRIYIVDFKPEDAPIISAGLASTFGEENPPPTTWISVKGLAHEAFMIEIEADAVIPA